MVYVVIQENHDDEYAYRPVITRIVGVAATMTTALEMAARDEPWDERPKPRTWVDATWWHTVVPMELRA